MINKKLTLQNISKSYNTRTGKLQVLKNINMSIGNGERVAILGKNGAGKSTLIRIIGGIELPDYGEIISNMSISWPLGYSGGTQGSLTGLDNIRFISRIYGADSKKIISFVSEFSELGKSLLEPVKTYSSGMKGRLNFSLSLAFDFDCLLIDEGLAAGDISFSKKCHETLKNKIDCSIIMVSHSIESIKDFCQHGYVLEEGNLLFFDSLDGAIKHHNHNQIYTNEE